MTASAPDPNRSPAGFEARLAEHGGILFKIANSYCRAGEDRDDLVQEICLQLWRAYPSYDPGRRFSTWMYRVALNTAISFARSTQVRARRVVALEESGPGEIAATPWRDESEPEDPRLGRLYRSLQGLAELDRALVLLYLDDRSYREIAEILGISETNVGTKLSRFKQKVRQELTPEERETANGAR